MFATLGFRDGQFQISFKSWTDFGANVSLVQSYALGRNFPTQHPFFAGEPIRYHFLFWFQAGNFEFLGLNPVWSINLLSIMSLLALLILIATFAEVLFDSRVVGRIAASLFFFSTSLSYLPFLKSQSNLRGLVGSIVNAKEFLASGYPFRGETWGALSVNVFAFQRHLISGLGLLFVVLIFMVQRHRARAIRDISPTVREDSKLLEHIEEERAEKSPEAAPAAPSANENAEPEATTSRVSRVSQADLAAFIFCGAIVGLLVGLTSVGSGTLIIVALAFLFPRLASKELVGTDISHAVMLHIAATLVYFTCVRNAASTAAQIRRRRDATIALLGIHARASDRMAGSQVPRLDVWREVDLDRCCSGLFDRFSSSFVRRLHQLAGNCFSLSAQH